MRGDKMDFGPKILFVIPLLGGIPVTDSVVVSWFIVAFLGIIFYMGGRHLKNIPEGMQNVLEIILDFISSFVTDVTGPKGEVIIPYIGTIALYLIIANVIGAFGISPPTRDINIAASLAVLTIIYVIYSSIKARGFKGWLKSFTEPLGIILPFKILDIFTRPLSLAVRLFGNIMAGFIIMELVKDFVPVLVPSFLSLYFDFFDGLIQAVVFSLLTVMYVHEGMEKMED